MKRPGHDAIFAKLAESVSGSLEIEEEREIRAHVAQCSRCAEELALLQELATELRALPTPQPSPALIARVQRAVALELASRSDERLNAVVVVFLLLFSWTLTFTGFVLFRLLTGEGLSLVGALSSTSLSWTLTYFGVAWLGGAAAAVALGVYARKRRIA